MDKDMDVNLFDYDLPEELIAQTPLENREESRLMVLDKESGEVAHKKFPDIIEYLQPGDALVLNQTKVMPARLYGEKEGTGAGIEVLLLKQEEGDLWETLVKPAKRVKEGAVISFGDGRLKAVCEGIGEQGGRHLRFQYDGIFYEILDELGEMPLPPYIKEKLEDKDRYQTVYAKEIGSAAAPTAGLHFTGNLLEKIKEKGIHLAFVTLHVGLGTFRPVSVENIAEHEMHSEYYHMPAETADLLNKVKEQGGRIIAVGTTSIRTVETVANDNEGKFAPASGWTSIFIYPGYEFKAVEGLITNFHLPKSTLMMLISALAGREQVLAAYEEAVEKKYRFFSFGDAMYIK